MEIAVLAAKNAGEILLQNFDCTQELIYKGSTDVVTKIDYESENIIVSTIKNNFPDHNILSEESQYTQTNSIFRWIIDPLDGTVNYIHKHPYFCVSIALEIDNKLTIGVIYNPITRELFQATSGKGAYVNDVRLSVSKTKYLDKSYIASCFPYNIKTKPNNNLIKLNHFSTSSYQLKSNRDYSIIILTKLVTQIMNIIK